MTIDGRVRHIDSMQQAFTGINPGEPPGYYGIYLPALAAAWSAVRVGKVKWNAVPPSSAA